jgi:phosphoribosylformylglycinamidine synthase
VTVQNTLQQLGFPVIVKRHVHWEIQAHGLDAAMLQTLKQTSVLYNEQKEIAISYRALELANMLSFLVRTKEDILGQCALQTLHRHFGLININAIYHGILWHFTSETVNIEEMIESILQTHIISNPYAHDCYQYSIL